MPQTEIDFVAPAQTMVGPGASSKVGQALTARGVPIGMVVVVADRAVHGLGITGTLLAGLDASGYRHHVVADLSAEPSSDELDRVAAEARDQDAVAVVGIGGGSAMDAAKLISLVATSGGAVADWAGVARPRTALAPLVLIPTTVGTGAEATRIAMVTHDGKKQISSCVSFVPTLAVLDPTLVAQLPAPVVAATAMDALAHAVEALMSTNRNPMTVAASTTAIELMLQNIDDAMRPQGVDARADLLMAAHQAGLALNAGVVLGHSLAYLIANRTELSHGVTCAMSLPYCLAYNGAMDPSVAAQIARLLTRGASEDLTDAIGAIHVLNQRLGMPQSLEAAGIAPEELEAMVTECVDRYPRPNNPVPFAAGRLRALLAAMYVGDPFTYGRTISERHDS